MLAEATDERENFCVDLGIALNQIKDLVELIQSVSGEQCAESDIRKHKETIRRYAKNCLKKIENIELLSQKYLGDIRS